MGETGTQETFCCWYLAFSCLLDDIDFQCKGRSFWRHLWRNRVPQACCEACGPLVPAIGIGICVRRWNMLLMPGASQWQSVGRKATDRFLHSGGGRHFMSSHVFLCPTEWYFTVFWYKCSDYIRDNFCLIWLTALGNECFLLDRCLGGEASASHTYFVKEKIFSQEMCYWLSTAPNQR